MKALRFVLLGAALVAASPVTAQTITVALESDIRSTNPGVNRDGPTDGVLLNIIEGLVGYRENGSVGLLLAESLEMSDDGLTYTFKLREGVKFHNGAEMTSADVLWSYKRYLDPETEWRCTSQLDGRTNLKIEAIDAPDPYTVTMRINNPSALFLDTLARLDCGMAAILHKDSVNPDGSWNKPIATGPFKLQEWRRGEFTTLSRFDEYRSPVGDKPDGYLGLKDPHVTGVKFIVVSDPAAAKAAVLTGAADIISVTLSSMPEFKTNEEVKLAMSTTAAKYGFLFQTGDPLLGNLKLREAIAAAIDMHQLVGAVSENVDTPNASAIYVASSFYNDVHRKGYKYDPDHARQLLKEAGYKGEQIKILTQRQDVMYPSAIIAQAMLQAVGITAEVEVLETATHLDRYNKGNYQMMSFAYSPRFDPALSYESFMGPKATQVRKVWDNPEAQAILEKASRTSDEKERSKLFDELHERQLSDVPALFTFNRTDVFVHSNRIVGFIPWVASTPRLWGVRVAE